MLSVHVIMHYNVWCTVLLYFQHVAATAQGKEQLLADVTLQFSQDEVKEDSLVEALVGKPLPMRQGLPLVEDWDCLRVSSCSVSPSAVLPGSAQDSIDASQVLWSPLSLSGTIYVPRIAPCSFHYLRHCACIQVECRIKQLTAAVQAHI